MLDIGSTNDEALAFSKVDAPLLCLNDTAIAYDEHRYVYIFGWMCDTGRDVQLVRELGAEFHNGRVVLAKEIDFVRG